MMCKYLWAVMVCVIPILFKSANGQNKNKLSELGLAGCIKTMKTSYYAARDSSGVAVPEGGILYSHAPVSIQDFDESGTLKEKIEFFSDSSYVKHLMEYNSGGNPTEDIVWTPEGNIMELTFYTYDEKGNLEKCENKQVSKNEKLTRKEDYMRVRGPYRKRVYTYDAKGKKNCEITYDAHGFRTVLYSCDGKGNITGQKYVDEEGKTEKSLSWTLDEKNNPLVYKLFDGEGKLQSYTVYKYDSQSLLSEETEFTPDGSVIHALVYVYTIDTHKNWVKQVTLQDKVPVRIVFREISYCE